MERLADMMARFGLDGRVAWIGVRPTRRAEMRVLDRCEIGAGGLHGDRARPGKRAVTLIQAEHLAVMQSFLETEVTWAQLRRNIVVEGTNLAALRGAVIGVGTARLHITGVAAPCSRMEEAFGSGGYNAVRGHGGVTAEVVAQGEVALGDRVGVIEPPNLGKG